MMGRVRGEDIMRVVFILSFEFVFNDLVVGSMELVGSLGLLVRYGSLSNKREG